MPRAITIRHGKIRAQLSGDLEEFGQAIISSLSQDIQAKMHGFLDEAERYVESKYPDKGSPNAKRATGFSKRSFNYDFRLERGAQKIFAEVNNDATNYGKLPIVREEFEVLERRFKSGEPLTKEELDRFRLLENVLYSKGSKSVQPYVIYVHRGVHWQYIRRLQREAMRAMEGEVKKPRRRRGRKA